jgi:hypothetical protein
VAEDGGLIAGHARVLAARQLGIAEIPVMVAAGWTEAQKRAYVLADNQLAITGGFSGCRLPAANPCRPTGRGRNRPFCQSRVDGLDPRPDARSPDRASEIRSALRNLSRASAVGKDAEDGFAAIGSPAGWRLPENWVPRIRSKAAVPRRPLKSARSPAAVPISH